MELRCSIFGSTRTDDSKADESGVSNIKNGYKMSQANKECHCVRRINEDSQSKPHRKNEFKNV